jgi:hypothetical protein
MYGIPPSSWAPVIVISSASFGFTPTNFGVTPTSEVNPFMLFVFNDFPIVFIE